CPTLLCEGPRRPRVEHFGTSVRFGDQIVILGLDDSFPGQLNWIDKRERCSNPGLRARSAILRRRVSQLVPPCSGGAAREVCVAPRLTPEEHDIGLVGGTGLCGIEGSADQP